MASLSSALLESTPARGNIRRMGVATAMLHEGVEGLRNFPFSHANLAGHAGVQQDFARNGPRGLAPDSGPGSTRDTLGTGECSDGNGSGAPGFLYARTVRSQTMDHIAHSRKET